MVSRMKEPPQLPGFSCLCPSWCSPSCSISFPACFPPLATTKRVLLPPISMPSRSYFRSHECCSPRKELFHLVLIRTSSSSMDFVVRTVWSITSFAEEKYRFSIAHGYGRCCVGGAVVELERVLGETLPLSAGEVSDCTQTKIAEKARPQTTKKNVLTADVDVILQKLRESGFRTDITEYLGATRCSLREKIKLLLEEGLTLAQVMELLTHPESRIFVQTSYNKLVSILDFLRTVNVTGQSAGKVLTRRSNILTHNLETLDRKVRYLQGFGLERKEMNKMILAYPSVWCLSMETLEKRIAYLQAIGIDRAGMSKIIRKSPQLICHPVERTMKFKFVFLQSKLASRELISKLLNLHPEILGLPIENLSKKVNLLEQLGFKENSNEIARALLALCTLSCRAVQARFDWLLCQGFTRDEASHMVRLQPSILGSKEESLSKKINYLVNVLNRDVKEIVKFPSFLNCSMERRIMPRFNVLAEWEKEGLLEGTYTLSSVLSCSSENFRKRFMDHPPKRRCRNGRH